MCVYLTGLIQGQNLCPNEDEGGAQVRRCCLQQLQHIGEDAHAECQINSPAAHVQEPAQEHERPQPVHLTQQHLRETPTL